jgi:hypothetical protein
MRSCLVIGNGEPTFHAIAAISGALRTIAADATTHPKCEHQRHPESNAKAKSDRFDHDHQRGIES